MLVEALAMGAFWTDKRSLFCPPHAQGVAWSKPWGRIVGFLQDRAGPTVVCLLFLGADSSAAI